MKKDIDKGADKGRHYDPLKAKKPRPGPAPKYPEKDELMRRAGISRRYALKILSGDARSWRCERILARIRQRNATRAAKGGKA